MPLTVLSIAEIENQLKALPHWTFKNNGLSATYPCNSYQTAVSLVNGIAQLADRLNHHPEITFTYSSVAVHYWTHSAGGVTEKDFDAAGQVSQLADDVLSSAKPEVEVSGKSEASDDSIRPKVADTKPAILTLDAGTYAWCSCGHSQRQPFCDGAHASVGMRPVLFKLDEGRSVALCNCKQTKNPPYCDGSHAHLSL